MLSILTHLRKNYNEKCDFCINGKKFSENCFYNEKLGRWFNCKSPYCNIHGLRNRRKRQKAKKLLFEYYEDTAHLTLHFRKMVDQKKQNLVYAELKRLVYKNYPTSFMLRINHWKKGKRHFHIVLGANEEIEKTVFKNCFIKALQSKKIEEASRYRLGCTIGVNPDGVLYYIYRCSRKFIKLPANEFPPSTERWLM